MGRYAFLLAAAIALVGALLHFAAPLLGPDWYAFLRAPAAVVASARRGTALAPAGSLLIGALMLACALYALAGAGAAWLRWLPFAPQAQGTIAAVCLLRGLLLAPHMLKFPALVSTFDILASVIWLVTGAAFVLGILVRQPGPSAAPVAEIAPLPGQAGS
jgi:hypothetical protein